MAPDPAGKGAALAVRRALDDAGARPADVQHINAHGTSTPLNDAAEARLIRRLFPHQPSVTSVKGTLGHLLGAAGAVEAAITALSVAHGRVPPVANLEKQEGDAEINAVTGTSRAQPVDLALSHSFGFGGHNAVLAFRSCPTEPARGASRSFTVRTPGGGGSFLPADTRHLADQPQHTTQPHLQLP